MTFDRAMYRQQLGSGCKGGSSGLPVLEDLFTWNLSKFKTEVLWIFYVFFTLNLPSEAIHKFCKYILITVLYIFSWSKTWLELWVDVLILFCRNCLMSGMIWSKRYWIMGELKVSGNIKVLIILIFDIYDLSDWKMLN